MVNHDTPTFIKVITVYPGRDPDDGGPSGDYTSVEVWFDLTFAARFGDEYHDQGRIKADAFIRGAAFAWKVAYDKDAPKPHYVERWPTE